VALIEVHKLVVELGTAAGWVRPVNEVSLEIGEGEAVGLVGESGSGKTMLSLALMGLLPAGARVSGQIRFAAERESVGRAREKTEAQIPRAENALERTSTLDAKNLTELSDEEWRRVRGREIAMIFQEPMTSLNPVMRVGAQIEEAVLAHEPRMGREDLRRRVRVAMEQAALPEPELRAEQFPHQLSGGLRQRAMIAMALAPRPKLLIADEPTTALDVTVQKQILDLLDRLRRELRLGLLFITHDLGVVAEVAERLAVMYAGRIVEEGPTENVLRKPGHPYTQGLLAASPTLERRELQPIPGTVPGLGELPRGCAFGPRCAFKREECEKEVPAMTLVDEGHAARCVLAVEKK
jgi:oligopeptide/dipeptide ABC transporter ATP-binding protein